MFRVFAIAALLLVVLAISGIVSLAWLLASRLGLHGWAALVSVTFAALLVVVLAVRAFWTMRRVASPLGAVMDAADSVAGGDYTTRVAERGPPPLRALARSFNTMTERLQHADRQRRDLMADLAHELRTPLSVLQGRIEGLIDGVYPPEPAQLEQLLDQTRILARLIEDLRTLALSDAGVLALQKELTDMTELMREVVDSFEAEAARRSISLELEAAPAFATLEVDPVRIKEVLVNLVSNAFAHTPAGGRVRLTLSADANWICMTVADTGAGMSAGEVARMFDRFYKGRHSRGAGLGLAIARNLVRAHDGDVAAQSTPGTGTTVTCRLPRAGVVPGTNSRN
ncbi:MAG TPA: HAMP domain-containing sensor histidine kinase [Steroidobacteraceae bacterium]|nr:HAMP domain-containing sensor histidine kinase [Steroidobacteraceae bacterium]